MIEIINLIKYVRYVKYEYQTTNHSRWIQGHFMLEISKQKIQNIVLKVFKSKIKKFLEECLQ